MYTLSAYIGILFINRLFSYHIVASPISYLKTKNYQIFNECTIYELIFYIIYNVSCDFSIIIRWINVILENLGPINSIARNISKTTKYRCLGIYA